MTEPLIDRIDALLPQTQCTKCGFDGCRPYAEAIARADAPINRCPPGGSAGIARLAHLLGRPILALDPACGAEHPHRVAWVDPEVCIGCTKCIAACPVDAIIGAAKRMHTVAAGLCSGCDLCIPVCPVDCITMRDDPRHPRWTDAQGTAARRRHDARRVRLAREVAKRDRIGRHGADRAGPERLGVDRGSDRDADRDAESRAAHGVDHRTDRGADPAVDPAIDHAERKRAVIAAALQRARARLAQR